MRAVYVWCFLHNSLDQKAGVTMLGFLNTDPSQAGGTLTEEDLLAWMDQVYAEPYRVCSPHVVHPDYLKRGGWAVCGNCFQPFEIRT